MKDKICLVTGGTSGIGKCAAIELAKQGAKVVIVGRDPSRGEQAKAEITTAAKGSPVDLMIADLSSKRDVRRLAEEFESKYNRLHVLVNNAGALFSSRQETVDGIERTIATNHLAYFMLAQLLLPVLKWSIPSRIVNVASGAHTFGHIDFEDLQFTKKYSGWAAYSRSKLANIMFTYELARRIDGTGVTANCMHPGAVRTRFFRGFAGISSVAVTLAAPFMRSPRKGAETVVYLASSPEVKAVSGKYFKDRKPIKSSPESMDVAAQRRLWEISRQLADVSAGLGAN